MTKPLGTAVESGVFVSFELDEDLGRGAAARDQDGNTLADEVASIAGRARLAIGRGQISPEEDFAGGEKIIVKDEGFKAEEERLVGGFAVGDDVQVEDLLTGLDSGGAVRGRDLLPLITEEAAVGEEREFAGLLDFAAGLSGFGAELGGGGAGVGKLADGEGFGGNALTALEDAE